MINNKIIRKIEDFVSTQPRSVSEIAELLNKNWRTADRYIEKIIEEFGSLCTKTFRKGTRGALKIVYLANIEKISSSSFQKILEENIMNSKKKNDFSGFDIFQHVLNKDKKVWMKYGKDEVSLGRLKEFEKLLLSVKKRILFFSGNLSFINFKEKNTNIFNILEKLVKKGIKIKVVCRVDITGRKNIEKILSLNNKYGKELIEIKHREQPLRATIIDEELINIKEIKKPTGRKHELKDNAIIFYTIKNKDWIKWLSNVFWKMFNTSIGSEKRLMELNKVLNL
jgi:hypothetical protein